MRGLWVYGLRGVVMLFGILRWGRLPTHKPRNPDTETQLEREEQERSPPPDHRRTVTILRQIVSVPRPSSTQLRKHKLRHEPHHKLHMLNHVPQVESL